MKKKSTSPNPILCRKPNQFSRARFGNIRWNKNCKVNGNGEINENGNGESGENTAGRDIDALERRFDEPAGGCPGISEERGE